MWILPKQLILAFVQDTEALTSDSVECARACARSLMRRSKPSQSSAYLREWKAGNLMRLRYGAISSPSLGQSFLERWTSSLEATPASPSAQQENEQAKTTQGTCGPTSQTAFDFFAPESASLRTSKGTSRWDSPASLAIWKSWVTRCRGAYSARLNAVRLTNASECLSWPTIRASEYKGCGPLGSKSHTYRVNKFYLDAVAQERTGQTGRLNPSWCEWMMGVPIGWTGCASSETESSQPQQP
jgi:hypothetical protein